MSKLRAARYLALMRPGARIPSLSTADALDFVLDMYRTANVEAPPLDELESEAADLLRLNFEATAARAPRNGF